jgi:rare lipoprotein A (peptidoglycan hydrolase)
VIERLGHETGWTWQPTVQTAVNSQGQFSATWSTNHIGEFEMRAVLAGSAAAPQTAERAATTSAAVAAPTVTITVYRPAVATWYGPGFFGRRTACGGRLTRSMLGVANRTLKCGEKVALYYNGRTLIVPVIDRGPYANGADWDLTEATGKALGIEDTVTIGAVSLPTPPASVARE